MSAPNNIEESLRKLAEYISNYQTLLHNPVKVAKKGADVNRTISKGLYKAIQGEVIINKNK